MKKHTAIVAVAAAWWAAPAIADQALAAEKLCMTCHQLEAKVVGPAYKEVAAKYKGNTDPATLASKIKAGVVGTWGQIPMPPQPTLTDEEAARLAAWILSL